MKMMRSSCFMKNVLTYSDYCNKTLNKMKDDIHINNLKKGLTYLFVKAILAIRNYKSKKYTKFCKTLYIMI